MILICHQTVDYLFHPPSALTSQLEADCEEIDLPEPTDFSYTQRLFNIDDEQF